MGERVCGSESSAWLEERQKGIGASEAAAALGASRYSQPLEVYHRKRGEMLPFEGNAATLLGQRMEPVVVQYFQDATGLKVKQGVGLWRHSQHSYMLATPDGVVQDNGQGLELKTTMSRSAGSELGEDGSDDLPVDWLIQAQQQIAVCNLESVYFGVFLLDLRKFRWFVVDRNADLIDSMVEGEGELWQRIQDGDPPAADHAHPGTMGLLQSRYPEINPDNTVDMSIDAYRNWQKACLLAMEIKQLEELQRELKAKAFEELGDAAAGIWPGGEKMLRRKLMKESTYTTTRKARVDIREVKVPKGLVK